MALEFPLTFAQFMDFLPIQEMTFDLPEAVQVEETMGGEILTSSLGTRLWQGKVSLGEMTADEAADAMAMIDLVRGNGGSFMCFDKSRPGPRAHLAGTILGASTVTLHSVSADMCEVRLAGVPSGFPLQRYDALGFGYGSAPVRFARHRLVSTGVGNGSSPSSWIQVVPPIRQGFAIGASVSLLKPACKAIITPRSVEPGRVRHTMTVGASFSWQQTLR